MLDKKFLVEIETGVTPVVVTGSFLMTDTGYSKINIIDQNGIEKSVEKFQVRDSETEALIFLEKWKLIETDLQALMLKNRKAENKIRVVVCGEPEVPLKSLAKLLKK